MATTGSTLSCMRRMSGAVGSLAAVALCCACSSSSSSTPQSLPDAAADGQAEAAVIDAAEDVPAVDVCANGFTIDEYCSVCHAPGLDDCSCWPCCKELSWEPGWLPACHNSSGWRDTSAGCGYVVFTCNGPWDGYRHVFDANTGKFVGWAAWSEGGHHFPCEDGNTSSAAGVTPPCQCPCNGAADCMAMANDTACNADGGADAELDATADSGD